jgi:DNA repair protein RecO
VPYGETDCVVRLFTKNQGRLSAFYRRGMAPGKNKSMVQAPHFAHIALKDSLRGLSKLISLDLEPESWYPCPAKVLGYRAYVAELLEIFIPEGESAFDVYAMTQDAFLALLKHGANPAILRAFELKLLAYGGYLPEFFADASLVVAFDPLGQTFQRNLLEGFFPFSEQAYRLAQSMLIAKIGRINYQGPELRMIGRIFQTRLKLMGVRPLKSVAFLKELARS